MPGRLRARVLALLALALFGCAHSPRLRDAPSAPTLPDPLATRASADLRGVYRAALCARLADACESALQRFAGEHAAPAPPRADASAFHLVFVPGFLANCFSGINSFADIVGAARDAGYAVDVLATGGRNSVEADAKLLAAQLARIADDGRAIVLFGHSKGAADALTLVVEHPELAARIVAVVGIAPAFNGSPLAGRLHGLYRTTLAANPLLHCARAEGDALEDMRPEQRAVWWHEHASAIPMPVYTIATMPDSDRVAPLLSLPYTWLASITPYNDGQLLTQDQVAPGGRLIGIVNVDHLSVAIPSPHQPWRTLFSSTPFPRPEVVLAALDVVAADLRLAHDDPARRATSDRRWETPAAH
jgi:predicted esterase